MMTKDGARRDFPDSYICRCTCVSFLFVKEMNEKLELALFSVTYDVEEFHNE